MSRIGVYVCWCGSNIANTVDVEAVANAASEIQGVTIARHYKYMCSDPGQNLIINDIKEYKLTGVVVAACSPRMHEPTFRTAASNAGLNPYLVEMANIREHCSWVHNDKEEGTIKAIDLVRMMVERVKYNEPLEEIYIPMTKRALVIGGGIAGIQAALDIANGGGEVILVEKSPSIGGRMAQLSETFPTLDCSQCILTPRMVEVANHPKIKLYSYSEIESVEGYIGNFKVKIRQKATSVNADICTGCGDCWNKCPQKKIPSEFDEAMGKRTAIYVPFPQAVPNIPVIDRETCTWFKTYDEEKGKGKCGICAKICQKNAIDYKDVDKIIEEEIGAIVVAVGYEIMDTTLYGEYGYGKSQDIITGLAFERLVSASGPTNGKLLRPSDGKEPKSIAFIQCVGSRDERNGVSYCIKICCMYTAKHAMLYKHAVHDKDTQAYVFYIDVRAGGKGYEEFWRRACEEDDAIYLRGRVSKIYPRKDKLILRGVDTLSGTQIDLEVDMVVLATAIVSNPGIEKLAQKLNIGYDKYGFLSEAHPKLRPVETNTAGIFLAGCCQAPKDIPDTVAQASATASKVQALFSSDELARAPLIASIDKECCVNCLLCVEACPYKAISEVEILNRRGELIKKVAEVNPGLCQGCGVCVSTCKSNCPKLAGFNDEQIFASIQAFVK